MTLEQAKAVADNPSGFSPSEWETARLRLEKTRSRIYAAGASERGQERFERRVQYLGDFLAGVRR